LIQRVDVVCPTGVHANTLRRNRSHDIALRKEIPMDPPQAGLESPPVQLSYAVLSKLVGVIPLKE